MTTRARNWICDICHQEVEHKECLVQWQRAGAMEIVHRDCTFRPGKNLMFHQGVDYFLGKPGLANALRLLEDPGVRPDPVAFGRVVGLLHVERPKRQ